MPGTIIISRSDKLTSRLDPMFSQFCVPVPQHSYYYSRTGWTAICAVCACGPHITVVLVKVGPTGHGSVASET